MADVFDEMLSDGEKTPRNLLKAVIKRKSMTVQDAVTELGIDKPIVRTWAKGLVEKGLLQMTDIDGQTMLKPSQKLLETIYGKPKPPSQEPATPTEKPAIKGVRKVVRKGRVSDSRLQAEKLRAQLADKEIILASLQKELLSDKKMISHLELEIVHIKEEDAKVLRERITEFEAKYIREHQERLKLQTILDRLDEEVAQKAIVQAEEDAKAADIQSNEYGLKPSHGMPGDGPDLPDGENDEDRGIDDAIASIMDAEDDVLGMDRGVEDEALRPQQEQEQAYQPEQTIQQEPTQQEPTQQEPTQQEPTQQEPTQQEPTQQEPTQQEPTQQEPTQQEPTQQEQTYQQEPEQTIQRKPAQQEPEQKYPQGYQEEFQEEYEQETTPELVSETQSSGSGGFTKPTQDHVRFDDQEEDVSFLGQDEAVDKEYKYQPPAHEDSQPQQTDQPGIPQQETEEIQQEYRSPPQGYTQPQETYQPKTQNEDITESEQENEPQIPPQESGKPQTEPFDPFAKIPKDDEEEPPNPVPQMPDDDVEDIAPAVKLGEVAPMEDDWIDPEEGDDPGTKEKVLSLDDSKLKLIGLLKDGTTIKQADAAKTLGLDKDQMNKVIAELVKAGMINVKNHMFSQSEIMLTQGVDVDRELDRVKGQSVKDELRKLREGK